MSREVEQPRWEWVAGLFVALTYAILRFAVDIQSWWLLVVALAIPVLFTLVHLLAADPRTD